MCAQAHPPIRASAAEDDVLLIKRAFEKAGIPDPVYFVRDGKEVISYLKVNLRQFLPDNAQRGLVFQFPLA